jgi:hypothetical protein
MLFFDSRLSRQSQKLPPGSVMQAMVRLKEGLVQTVSRVRGISSDLANHASEVASRGAN